MENQGITVMQVLQELEAMVKEFYIADVERIRKELIIKFENGQMFTVSVDEI